ncbi:MAG: FUSC family protein, partial [Brachybacterium sp.]|nr:FUSC family protein [Brachybacterium sp.]
MSMAQPPPTGGRAPLTPTTSIPIIERARDSIHDWFVQGVTRGRGDVLTVGRAALAASLAYLISGILWGHEFPFFSSIVAFVIIGFGIEKKMRKIVEMSCGVLLGLLLGELARGLLGSGTWQILVVVFVAGMLARLIDSSNLFGFQVAIQSLLV